MTAAILAVVAAWTLVATLVAAMWILIARANATKTTETVADEAARWLAEVTR